MYMRIYRDIDNVHTHAKTCTNMSMHSYIAGSLFPYIISASGPYFSYEKYNFANARQRQPELETVCSISYHITHYMLCYMIFDRIFF